MRDAEMLTMGLMGEYLPLSQDQALFLNQIQGNPPMQLATLLSRHSCTRVS